MVELNLKLKMKQREIFDGASLTHSPICVSFCSYVNRVENGGLRNEGIWGLPQCVVIKQPT